MNKGIEFIPGEISCPVCSGGKINIYYNYKEFIIYKCLECRMLFRAHGSDEFYDWHSDKVYCAENLDLSGRKAMADGTVKRIQKDLKIELAGLKVLEIGVGMGVLGEALIMAGANYEGIEPSRHFFKKSLDTFPALKGRVKNCFLCDASLKENDFDLIVMVDTLEHVAKPLELLKQSKRLLKPSGILYLEAPSEYLLKTKAFIRRKLGLYAGYPTHVDHVSLFTKQTLKEIAIRAGFWPIAIKEIMVLGDYHRMHMLMPSLNSFFLRSICMFFRIVKIDNILKTGNLSVALK
jgi:2-polyprenyl-3-methyl-5-hydroxy-6-metoxy-1,4-benzoquinol methylase